MGQRLNDTEEYRIRPDGSGLAFRVEIKSLRAHDLLLSLHREVFGALFARPEPVLTEGGFWAAQFGFVDGTLGEGIRVGVTGGGH